MGSAADFSCRCGTAVTWRFLPPSGIIQSSTQCLQLNTLARPWHMPSRHPHQSHRGLPGPSPAATSSQLVQTWRERTAEHPALSSSRLLWGSRGCLGCVVGATAGWATPHWGGGGGACETSVPVKLGSCSLALAAFNCFVSASLCRWSLPPCPSEPRQRGMKSLWQVNVLERGWWSAAPGGNLADWKSRNNHPNATGVGGLWCCRELAAEMVCAG